MDLIKIGPKVWFRYAAVFNKKFGISITLFIRGYDDVDYKRSCVLVGLYILKYIFLFWKY